MRITIIYVVGIYNVERKSDMKYLESPRFHFVFSSHVSYIYVYNNIDNSFKLMKSPNSNLPIYNSTSMLLLLINDMTMFLSSKLNILI